MMVSRLRRGIVVGDLGPERFVFGVAAPGRRGHPITGNFGDADEALRIGLVSSTMWSLTRNCCSPRRTW